MLIILMILPPHRFTLFPYTTLFRSAFDVTGTLRGLLYVMNALTPSGTSPVHGLVVAQSLAAADRSQTGLPVSFDCAGANGAGKIPTGWFLTGGSYKEVSGH